MGLRQWPRQPRQARVRMAVMGTAITTNGASGMVRFKSPVGPGRTLSRWTPGGVSRIPPRGSQRCRGHIVSKSGPDSHRERGVLDGVGPSSRTAARLGWRRCRDRMQIAPARAAIGTSTPVGWLDEPTGEAHGEIRPHRRRAWLGSTNSTATPSQPHPHPTRRCSNQWSPTSPPEANDKEKHSRCRALSTQPPRPHLPLAPSISRARAQRAQQPSAAHQGGSRHRRRRRGAPWRNSRWLMDNSRWSPPGSP